MKVYIIGSLRNPEIPLIGRRIRKLGFDVFDDWWGAGERADETWKEYEKLRGRSYRDALHGQAATNIFTLDHRNLNTSDVGVLVLPAGRSGHIELGYLIGQGKRTYVLFNEEPSTRWDVMYRFATDVFFTETALKNELKHLLTGGAQ